jgi:hypothetical protein
VNALADAQDDFEATYLQPNLSLINARNEVERLRFELSQAEQKLAAIEAKGDSVTRLTHAVTVAESQLEEFVGKAESAELGSLAYSCDIVR